MRYDEFRDRWQVALRSARLLAHHDRPEESIDLTTTERRWRLRRSYTCEQDLLTELVGRRAGRSTQPRQMRVDIVLGATLPYGSTTPRKVSA